MPINTLTEEVIKQKRETARQEIQAMRALREQTFKSGSRVLLGDDPLPVIITAGLDPTAPQTHFFAIGASAEPPVIAQRLPCGILDVEKSLVAARRSDRQGQFAAEVPEGEFSLRPVLEVRERIDVDILDAIGDDAAYDQLQVALPRLEDPLKSYVQRLLARRVEPGAVAAAARPASREPIIVARLPRSLDAAADDGAERQRGASELRSHFWIDEKNQRLVIRCPAAQIEFPFSAALVEVYDGEVRIASRLVPVQRAADEYRNSISLDELLGGGEYHPRLRVVLWYDRWNVLQRTSLEEIDRALNSEYVKLRPDVAAGLMELRRACAEDEEE